MTTATATTALPAAAPTETVTPIRPSEAIRLGCLLAPVQAFRASYVMADGSTCAMGAMTLGMYGRTDWLNDDRRAEKLDREFYNAHLRDVRCPAASECRRYAPDVVHLNDDHRWSRERIADWLEGLGL